MLGMLNPLTSSDGASANGDLYLGFPEADLAQAPLPHLLDLVSQDVQPATEAPSAVQTPTLASSSAVPKLSFSPVVRQTPNIKGGYPLHERIKM